MAKAIFAAKPLKTRKGVFVTERAFKKEFLHAFADMDSVHFYDIFYAAVRVRDAYAAGPVDGFAHSSHDPRLSFALEEFGSRVFDPLYQHLLAVKFVDDSGEL